MAKTSGTFRFRRGDTVGAADADNDRQFLESCFVDNGDATVLLNCDNPKCIVVGRTGSGKTSLLLEVEKRAAGHTERIAPESLSLNHIANSDTVHILSNLGVNLDPFFRLLWRHVLALQILQHIRPVTEAEKANGLLAWIGRFLREDKSTVQKAARHKRVVEFIEKHGGKEFWGDVSQRVEGIVVRFEKEIEQQSERSAGVSVGMESNVIKASTKFGDTTKRNDKNKVVSELTIEDRRRFQHVINEMHLKELDGILDLVAEVMEDAGRNVYVVIDRLDLQWADESIRFRLIRALIDTAIAFAPVARVKIILAMRIDLIERVYRDARHEPGTQSEKVRDYYLTLMWDASTLEQMLNERVNKLCSDRYAPNYKVTLADISNERMRKGRRHGAKTLEFIIQRTWLRPRDLIDFFNACIERSAGNPKISDDTVLEAEGEYSRNRLRSLAEEWQLEYPFLDDSLSRLLREKDRRFRLNTVSDNDLCEWVSQTLTRSQRDGDRLHAIANSVDQSELSFDDARVELAAAFYKVGAVGVQNDESEKAQWATNLSYSLSPSEIHQSSYLYIHPGLWKALGITQDQENTP